MKLLKWPGIVVGATALLAMIGLSERVASWTMTDRYYARIGYACMRGRIAPFPGDGCNADWIAALRYEVARIRYRSSRRISPGLGCGDEASVYRRAVDGRFWGFGPPVDSGGADVVLLDSTGTTITPSSLWQPADILEAFWALRSETLTDFQRRNASPILLSAFDLPSALIMSQAVWDSLRLQVAQSNDHFKWFYQRYPDAAGLLRLSRPGLSAGGNQALIEVGWTKRALYGGGTLLLLECRDGVWSVADSVGTWAS